MKKEKHVNRKYNVNTKTSFSFLVIKNVSMYIGAILGAQCMGCRPGPLNIVVTLTTTLFRDVIVEIYVGTRGRLLNYMLLSIVFA